MTTLLADAKLGMMVSDSSMSDGDRVWGGKKVWRIKNSLVGLAGDDATIQNFLVWYRGGMKTKIEMGISSALILSHEGLFFMDANYAKPNRLTSDREAIGTGGKAAICVHEALGFKDARAAVRIVCKHDAASRGPVRSYKL